MHLFKGIWGSTAKKLLKARQHVYIFAFCLNIEFLCDQVLSDDKKRALYDQYGEAGVKSTVGGASGAYTVINHQL